MTRSEQALRTAPEGYWRPDLVVFDPDGIHVIDPDGRVIRLPRRDDLEVGER